MAGKRPLRSLLIAACSLTLCSICVAAGEPTPQGRVQASAPTFDLDIPEQDLDSALQTLARLSGHRLFYRADLVKQKISTPLKGRFTADEAITRLLSGTGLVHEITPSAVVLIRSKEAASVGVESTKDQSSDRRRTAVERSPITLARADAPAAAAAAEERDPDIYETGKGVSEMLVRGSAVLNMDIRRRRDDAQPYMVFDREELETSGAPTLEAFFKHRLTTNVSAQETTTTTLYRGLSQINLRGLGINQTLILVDGRRVPTPQMQGLPFQPDVNSFPMAAVERVEVLSTTSSGIYGGNATGGVINIVLRRDFTGAQTRLTYDNSFDANSALKRFDFSAGTMLEGGRTSVLVSGSVTEGDPLLQGKRDFYQRAVNRILENNPAYILNTTPTLSVTPNIRSSNGSNLVLKSGPALNSPITYVPDGYEGAASDGGAALVANAGRYRLDQPDLPTYLGGGTLYPLVAGLRRESMMAMVRREFRSGLEAYVDMALGNSRNIRTTVAGGQFTVPASAPTNPFTTNIVVRVPIYVTTDDDGAYTQNRRISAGLILKLPRQWRSMLDLSYGQANMLPSASLQVPAATTALVSSGAIDVLRDPAKGSQFTRDMFIFRSYSWPSESKMRAASWRASGPLFNLPAGPVVLSSLLDYRRTSGNDMWLFSNDRYLYYPSNEQTNSSAYVELFMPLVSEEQSIPGIKDLSLQLAGRYDRNRATGAPSGDVADQPVIHNINNTSSTNPTLALRYKPVDSVIMRASYGTGFLAPSAYQLSPIATFQNTGPNDPRRGGLPGGRVDVLAGGNPDLQPERSTTWSAGLVFTPEWLQGLRLSADYVSIRKKDNIASINAQTIVNNEEHFPGRVVRGPLEPGDPYEVGPIIFVDYTNQNIARTEMSAWDFSAEYLLGTASAGNFKFSASMTLTERYRTQLLFTLPWSDALNVARFFSTTTDPGIILKYRGNAGVQWNRGPWRLAWYSNYYGSYWPAPLTNGSLIQAQGGRVPSQLFHDMTFGYSFDDGGRSFLPKLTDGLSVSGGIRNVLNTTPEVDIGNQTFSYMSGFGDARLRSYHITLTKQF